MLDDLKDLIDDFDHIISLDISEVQKKERFLEAEIKLGILLSNISKAIYGYAGDTFIVEDETLTNLVIRYIDSLKREDIHHHLDILKYYSYHMIPFYKGYQKVVLEALNQNNKSLLLQAGEWTIALNFRSILMIYILKHRKKDHI
jgi:hypothetical protein